MLQHVERVAAARAAVDYITGRSETEQRQPVPNCPGWTVYNAAVHIGRVSIAWQEMIRATPEDPDSRTRGYERSDQKSAGTPTSELAAWAHSALDQLADDSDRRCYFSMTGGEGTPRLWAWHAASELGVHRLDVEAALGHPHSLTDAQALDAVTYTCQYFLPAMRRVTGEDPGQVDVHLVADGQATGNTIIESDATRSVQIEGRGLDVLLALWGRPHGDVRIVAGSDEVWSEWRDLPSQAFQFGTWD